MSKSEDVIRVSFNLYMSNPIHRQVYDILQKQKNKNSYLRNAVLHYDQEFRGKIAPEDEMRELILISKREIIKEIKEISGKVETESKEKSEQGYIEQLKNVF